MDGMHTLDELAKFERIKGQVRETVKQEAAGVGVRTATMTCGCGWQRSVMLMYKCLYCGEWFCFMCAEKHFGKTIAQYKDEKKKILEACKDD